MKTLALFTLAILCIFGCSAEEMPQKSLVFTPPQGWFLADEKELPESVKVMVLGKGKSEYPPSINLGLEPYEGSLKSYLKIVKEINRSQHADWQDLGKIQTQAGPASLSQVDMRTEWGQVRLMHVIFVHEKVAYIMTAAAKREEFPEYHQTFFKAMKSLRFYP